MSKPNALWLPEQSKGTPCPYKGGKRKMKSDDGITTAEMALLTRLSQLNRDLPGEDMEDIIRYPGSRRTFYMRQPSGTLIIYHNPCGPIQAIAFHRVSMLSKGWKISQYMGSNSKPSASICFYKKARRCIINVSRYRAGSHTLVIYHEGNNQIDNRQ